MVSRKFSKKKCRPDQIMNITGRCVLRNGVIGKRLLSNKKKDSRKSKRKSKKEKKCRSGFLVNPESGSCVSVNGSIGSLLILKKIKKSKKPNMYWVPNYEKDYSVNKMWTLKDTDCSDNYVFDPINNKCTSRRTKLGSSLINGYLNSNYKNRILYVEPQKPEKEIKKLKKSLKEKYKKFKDFDKKIEKNENLEKIIDEYITKSSITGRNITRKSEKFIGADFQLFLAMMVYLLKKHSDICFVWDRINVDPIQWTCVQGQRNSILQYNLKKLFNKCSKKTRFTVIFLNLENRTCKKIDGLQHSNILIYDRNNKSIERFEPHGSFKDFDQDLLDSWLSEYTKKELKVKEYIRPSSICPIGLQKIHEKKEKYHTGFCGLWSIWYLDLRLTFPDVSPEHLLKTAINHLEKAGFTEFIYNYSRFAINFTRSFKNKYSEILEKYKKEYQDNETGKNYFMIDFLDLVNSRTIRV